MKMGDGGRRRFCLVLLSALCVSAAASSTGATSNGKGLFDGVVVVEESSRVQNRCLGVTDELLMAMVS